MKSTYAEYVRVVVPKFGLGGGGVHETLKNLSNYRKFARTRFDTGDP